jgi:hypothetical protein
MTGERKTGSNTLAGLAATRRGVVDHAANLRAVAERVVISRTTIEIELA